jgi:heterodisulfide reductase subunit A-like polyferredoxin
MLLMIRKDVYVVQPYEVGTKDRKSLAIIIPAEVAREYKINPSAVLVLKINQQTNGITLCVLSTVDEDKKNSNITVPVNALQAPARSILWSQNKL